MKSKNSDIYKTNYGCRLLGLLLGLTPLVALLISFISGLGNTVSYTYSILFMLVALLIACLNFYLSVIRPFIFKIKHGSMAGYNFISGVPIVGSILIIFGLLSGFGSMPSSIIGVAAYSLDTAGLGWLVVASWDDRSLWDEKIA